MGQQNELYWPSLGCTRLLMPVRAPVLLSRKCPMVLTCVHVRLPQVARAELADKHDFFNPDHASYWHDCSDKIVDKWNGECAKSVSSIMVCAFCGVSVLRGRIASDTNSKIRLVPVSSIKVSDGQPAITADSLAPYTLSNYCMREYLDGSHAKEAPRAPGVHWYVCTTCLDPAARAARCMVTPPMAPSHLQRVLRLDPLLVQGLSVIDCGVSMACRYNGFVHGSALTRSVLTSPFITWGDALACDLSAPKPSELVELWRDLLAKSPVAQRYLTMLGEWVATCVGNGWCELDLALCQMCRAAAPVWLLWTSTCTLLL